jgi:acetyl-CoA carboxylase biotin carboxyl carrier protein
MDFNQVQELIRLVSKQKITEFILKQGDFKLVIRQGMGASNSENAPTQVVVPVAQPMVTMAPPVVPATVAAPVAAPAPAASAPAATEAPAVASNTLTIKSPMVGTFYRSAGPDKPAFVNVGDAVAPGNTVCIIEAMKLFNEIESDVKGKIVKVLVDDASPVEYDQPLFLVEPA